MDARRQDHGGRSKRYRIVVAGRVGERWAEWFDADAVHPGDETTVLEIRVADQAELYGRLRRVQDLRLRLISVALVPPTSDSEGELP